MRYTSVGPGVPLQTIIADVKIRPGNLTSLAVCVDVIDIMTQFHEDCREADPWLYYN